MQTDLSAAERCVALDRLSSLRSIETAEVGKAPGQRIAYRPFRIGSWEVDPASNRLSRDGEQVALEPKVMDLLITLSRRQGEVCSRDDLLHTLWPGLTLGDDVLARAVSKLRRALGDDVRAPAYIETIPKRGYRLLSEVRPPQARAGPRPDDRKPSSRSNLAIVASAVLAITVVIATSNPSGIGQCDAPIDEANPPEGQHLHRSGSV